MPHHRETIRDAVVSAVTNLATTGARVFRSRVYPISAHSLPALLVYCTEEAIEPELLPRPQKLRRTLTVVIEGYAKATSDVDETLDDIASEVETAIGSAPTLSGNCRNAQIRATSIEFADGGDQPVGIIRMEFAVDYRTAENAPTAQA